MIIIDEVWGKEVINEPVILELIDSPIMQRLKNISQHGIPQEYYPSKIFSRFDHSLGVFILLKRLNAGLTEQIAGLLHDVSHTAFSHLVDWIFGDPTKENYQDKSHLKVITNSEIPALLSRYNINYEQIASIDAFPLLDKPLPALCADRIDYALREINLNKFLSEKETEEIKTNLINFHGNIAFTSSKPAEIFAKAFSRCQNEVWDDSKNKARYHVLSQALKEALKSNIISEEDFRKTDGEVLKKLLDSKNQAVLSHIHLLSKGFSVKFSPGEEGIILRVKNRYIDPEVLCDDKLVALSKISEDYRHFINMQMKMSSEPKRIIIY